MGSIVGVNGAKTSTHVISLNPALFLSTGKLLQKFRTISRKVLECHKSQNHEKSHILKIPKKTSQENYQQFFENFKNRLDPQNLFKSLKISKIY